MKRLAVISMVLLWATTAVGFTQVPEGATEQILNLALQGQGFIFNRRYPEAEALFRKIAEQYPDSPLGSFGIMATLNAKMFENFDFKMDTEFDQEQRRNKSLVDKISKNENATAFDLFLCGASSGLRGFYYARLDKMLAALGESNQAKDCLERARKKDPQFPDVELGLGLFNYWRSVFTSRFKFLPFFKDRRAEGIAQVQVAIDRGVFVNDLARAALAFVYYEQNNGAAGLPLAQKLLETYPANLIMKNLKGNFLSLTGKNAEALAVYDEVLKQAPELNVARYFKGMAYFRSRDLSNSKIAFEQFLQNQPTPAWQSYAQYMLGQIALKENRRGEAFKHFKAGHHAYGDYQPNLKMILQMRKENK